MSVKPSELIEKLISDLSDYTNSPEFDRKSPSAEQYRKVIVDWVLNNNIKISNG
jgi:hypothetical protein